MIAPADVGAFDSKDRYGLMNAGENYSGIDVKKDVVEDEKGWRNVQSGPRTKDEKKRAAGG